jgi:hypothetical protein
LGKAVEDYRTPKRSAFTGAFGKFDRFWTAPVRWRFGNGLSTIRKGSALEKRSSI